MCNLTNEQLSNLDVWAKEYASKQDLPASFDVEIAMLNSVDNAFDVEASIAESCVKATFMNYVELKAHTY